MVFVSTRTLLYAIYSSKNIAHSSMGIKPKESHFISQQAHCIFTNSPRTAKTTFCILKSSQQANSYIYKDMVDLNQDQIFQATSWILSSKSWEAFPCIMATSFWIFLSLLIALACPLNSFQVIKESRTLEHFENNKNNQ